MKSPRKQKKLNLLPQQVNTNGWQIVYTGFILIMLCFFIMLTSFASLQQSKITRFARAFSTAVSVFKGGSSLEKGQTMINADALILSKEDKMARLFQQVRLLTQQNRLDQVSLHRDERGVVMTLADKLLFESGQAQLSASADGLLDRISRLIQTISVPIEIQGHTDNVPIHTSGFASNWELSTARAVNVLRYLVERKHVNPHRLSAVGFSEYQPMADNSSAAGRTRNRRVDIIFMVE